MPCWGGYPLPIVSEYPPACQFFGGHFESYNPARNAQRRSVVTLMHAHVTDASRFETPTRVEPLSIIPFSKRTATLSLLAVPFLRHLQVLVMTVRPCSLCRPQSMSIRINSSVMLTSHFHPKQLGDPRTIAQAAICCALQSTGHSSTPEAHIAHVGTPYSAPGPWTLILLTSIPIACRPRVRVAVPWQLPEL